MADPLGILLFAAGVSRRMRGADKLLEKIDGVPLLTRSARVALETGHPVTVLLPKDSPDRAKVLHGLPLRAVTVADTEPAMSATIRAGIASLRPDAPGAMFLMADMPDLRAADLLLLIEAFVEHGAARVIRATAQDGTPGSPSVVPRRLFPMLAALTGDRGGRDVLGREKPVLVPLPGRRALTDLDTPEDWAAWQAERGGGAS